MSQTPLLTAIMADPILPESVKAALRSYRIAENLTPAEFEASLRRVILHLASTMKGI